MKRITASMRYGLLAAVVLMILAAPEAWAKRTITGKITMPDGTPAKDMLVIAWDEDDCTQIQDPMGIADPIGDDALGHAVTDSAGNYTINYPGNDNGRKWDVDTLVSESWRPDIFLAVYVLQSSQSTQQSKMSSQYSALVGADGEWLRVYLVKQTGTKSNWMMSRDIHNWNIQLPGILGRISYANETPVAGLQVKAWDQDRVTPTNLNPNDLLSESITASDGRYFMLVPGGHKDWTPPNPVGVIAGTVANIATGGLPGVGIVVDFIASSATGCGWGSLMHRHYTSWRPDIFVVVYDGDGKPAKNSKVYDDWPHRKTLTVDLTVPDHVRSTNLAWLIPLISQL